MMWFQNWILEFSIIVSLLFCKNFNSLCEEGSIKTLQFLLRNAQNKSIGNYDGKNYEFHYKTNFNVQVNRTLLSPTIGTQNENRQNQNNLNTSSEDNYTPKAHEIENTEEPTTTDNFQIHIKNDMYYWGDGNSSDISLQNVSDKSFEDDGNYTKTTPANPLLEGMGFLTYGEEAFMWCEDRSVYASRYTGLPPIRENYWNGTLDIERLQEQNITINNKIVFLLELTNPANVTSNPSNWSPDSSVEIVDDRTFILRTGSVSKQLDFIVTSFQGLPFPRLASAALNEIPICRKLTRYGPSLIGPQAQAIASPLLPPLTYVPNCGRKRTDYTALVTEGELTKVGDWPWHVAIFLHSPDFMTKNYICGGTVISSTSIITAAHCMVTRRGQRIPAERFTVVLGKYDLYENDDSEVNMMVSAIVIHSGFNTETLANDIALINTTTSIEFGYYIQPICLWNSKQTTKEVIFGETGTLVGWGTNENATLSDKLMLARMRTVSDSRCLTSKPDFFRRFINNSSFCAGNGPKSGVSASNGDSGGGLHFPVKEVDGRINWYLRGLVSVSVEQPNTGLCDTRHFVVLTELAQYLDWIEDNGGSITYTWFYNSTVSDGEE